MEVIFWSYQTKFKKSVQGKLWITKKCTEGHGGMYNKCNRSTLRLLYCKVVHCVALIRVYHRPHSSHVTSQIVVFLLHHQDNWSESIGLVPHDDLDIGTLVCVPFRPLIALSELDPFVHILGTNVQYVKGCKINSVAFIIKFGDVSKRKRFICDRHKFKGANKNRIRFFRCVQFRGKYKRFPLKFQSIYTFVQIGNMRDNSKAKRDRV